MTTPTRTVTTENFPVASWLLKPAAREPILAFYRFARRADDIADSPATSPQQRLHQQCYAFLHYGFAPQLVYQMAQIRWYAKIDNHWL